MSVAADIAGAVKTAIDAMALGVTVVRRKTPSVPEGEALPQIAISVGEEGEHEPLTARAKLVTYPVAVTIVTKADAKLADDDAIRTWRESIPKRLEAAATFAAVSQFNAVFPGGKEPFDRSALAKDLNYSSLVYRVEAIEDNR